MEHITINTGNKMNIWTKEVNQKFDNLKYTEPFDLKDLELKLGVPEGAIRVKLGDKSRKFDELFITAGLDEHDVLMVKHENRLYYVCHSRTSDGPNSRIADMWLSECTRSTLRETLDRIS